MTNALYFYSYHFEFLEKILEILEVRLITTVMKLEN